MAAAVTTALALCALLTGASARGRSGDYENHCTTVTKGDTSGRMQPLEPVVIAAGVLRWMVDVPRQACAPDRVVGYKAKACDPDGPPAPTVDALSLEQVLVTRHTAAASPGTVGITVYCAPAPLGYSGRSGGGGGRWTYGGGGGGGRWIYGGRGGLPDGWRWWGSRISVVPYV